MKLLRYGLPGQEKPGILDNSGQIRDLSGLVPDIAGAALLPESLTRLAKVDLSTLLRVEIQFVLARAWEALESFFASASTTLTTRLKRGLLYPRSLFFS